MFDYVKRVDIDETVSTKPKYVRVNTLKKTVEEAIEAFSDEGWFLIKHSDKNDYNGFIEKVIALKDGEFMVDMHIPSLLIFPPRTHFYNHPAYKNGTVILQDKASCLPVHLLAPPPGSTVLDMCAAPGMKTTQLAAALANEGVVYAVERDTKRVGTLKHIVGSSEATCVKIINKDVLDCAKKDFPGVEYILVDPSCSGSGMTERTTEAENKDLARLGKLAGFQILILRSALTRYPEVKRVAYSTCSLHVEENEEVVRQVLETNYNFKLVDAKKILNSAWNSFGSSDYGELGEFCLYARPNEDFTNGFFVAIFERLGEGEQNQFFNNRISNFKKHLQAADKRKERKLEGQENKENLKSKREKKNNKEKGVAGDKLDNGEVESNHIVEDVHEGSLDEGVGFAENVCEKGAKKKKKKKRNDEADQETVVNGDEIKNIVEKVGKKKNKKETSLSINDDITVKDKSKKNKYKNGTKVGESTEDTPKNDATLETNDTVGKDKTEKKKRKHSIGPKEDITLDVSAGNNDITVKVKSKKKKHEKCNELNGVIDIFKNDDQLESNDNIIEESKPKKKKHKMRTKDNEVIEASRNYEPIESNDNATEENKPKKKKRKSCSEVDELTEGSNNVESLESNDNITEENKPKKKHKMRSEDNEVIEASRNYEPIESNDDATEENKPKKKKRKSCTEVDESTEGSNNVESLESNDTITEENKPKKKHKRSSEVNELMNGSKNCQSSESNDNITEENKQKTKKRKHCIEMSETNTVEDINQLKKEKRKNCSDMSESFEASENPDVTQFTQKSKKKKKRTSKEEEL
nr:unnamed protein product [Callosobruchus chinensis]